MMTAIMMTKGITMAIPEFDVTRRRLQKAGREWFAQYMLASLLLGTVPAKMNTPFLPSTRGLDLLERLDPWRPGQGVPRLFWEFRLETPDPDQENRWPDLAAHWPNRILLVELKTESGSVRERQVDEYLELGLLHYPDIDVHLLYITKDRVPAAPAGLPERAGYATITWSEVADAIEGAWDDASGEDAVNAVAFASWIRNELMNGAPWVPPAPMVEGSAPVEPLPRAAVPADDGLLGEALRLADQVAADGQQRALDHAFADHEVAVRFRDQLLTAIKPNTTMSSVRPWVWRTASGGKALTRAGRATGLEVRLSRRG